MEHRGKPDAPNLWIIYMYLPTWKVKKWSHEQAEMAW